MSHLLSQLFLLGVNWSDAKLLTPRVTGYNTAGPGLVLDEWEIEVAFKQCSVWFCCLLLLRSRVSIKSGSHLRGETQRQLNQKFPTILLCFSLFVLLFGARDRMAMENLPF